MIFEGIRIFYEFLKFIQTVDDMWEWTIDNFAPKIRVSKWYNDDTVAKMGGFFEDFSSRIIGYAILRSHRVKNDSCKLSSQLKNMTNFCIESYSLFNEEKGDYGYVWSEYNDTYKPANGMQRVYKSFQYRPSTDLPIYSSYSEGGYIYEMRGKLSFIRGNMSLLQQMNWIDRQTRSMFIEFTTFNPNLNLFCISSILFEVLASGNVIKTPRFNVLKLLTTKSDAIEIGTGIAYLAVIVYFMFREIVKMFKLKKMYFKQFWSYLQWALIAFSWASLAMFIYKVLVGEKVKEFFKETNGYGYIRLQDISYWNDMFNFTIALCTCLATMKFIKLLRFNSSILVLITAIRNSLNELIGITFMMIIWYLAFVQLFYALFNEKIAGFSTMVKSMTTCFQALLGKFDIGPVIRESAILGPFFFAFYNLMVLLIIISVFITVISDSFIEVKRNKESYFIETDMSKYFIAKIKGMVKRTGLLKKKEEKDVLSIPSNNYVMEADLLPNRLNKLLIKINEYNKEKLLYENFVDQN
ncbi:polycystic kidney disease 1-like 2 [Brachionus plicatilis]|uniref:Polycystic kidney disease 1-like 2 n=1 Tax=Brachionus plicatilis TaxID=10195 RepID=A0A3M7S3L1_BRAPC|nr:polycystic kidney disease 1-like 2 [Brachionus plicatilis]